MMQDGPYVGQIMMFTGNYVPRGWLPCDGQVIAMSDSPTLGFLLGATYGGDGKETFGLPDLQGRVPMCGFPLGEQDGTETVTLTVSQVPVHNHTALIPSAPADHIQVPTSSTTLGDEVTADTAATCLTYAEPGGPQVQMTGAIGSSVGGESPHNNLQPYLAVMFCICEEGSFPSQS